MYRSPVRDRILLTLPGLEDAGRALDEPALAGRLACLFVADLSAEGLDGREELFAFAEELPAFAVVPSLGFDGWPWSTASASSPRDSGFADVEGSFFACVFWASPAFAVSLLLPPNKSVLLYAYQKPNPRARNKIKPGMIIRANFPFEPEGPSIGEEGCPASYSSSTVSN